MSETDPTPAAPEAAEAPRTSAPRRWGLLAAKLCGGCLAFALFLELLVTLVFGEQVKFPRHVVDGGFGVRINEPGASYRHTSPDVDVGFEINAQGMRAPRDYAYAKPEGTRRIVLVGDSFTAGYEVEFEESFGAVLERDLRAAGLQVEVLNAGVSGYSNAEACLYLERELLRYHPDLVVLSFFNNDLVDNVRSNLFGLQGGELVQKNQSYIPLGGWGDFLNQNFLFNFLSEHSNAFALLKEQGTFAIKRRAVEDNLSNMEVPASDEIDEKRLFQRRLAAGIMRRMHAVLAEQGVPLVIQNIPLYKPTSETDGVLIDVFPLDELGLPLDGLHYLPAADFLQPHVGREALYHLRSHTHWTPFSNELSGRALSRLIQEQGLLEERGPSTAAGG